MGLGKPYRSKKQSDLAAIAASETSVSVACDWQFFRTFVIVPSTHIEGPQSAPGHARGPHPDPADSDHVNRASLCKQWAVNPSSSGA